MWRAVPFAAAFIILAARDARATTDDLVEIPNARPRDEAAWLALHAGESLPTACADPDPVIDLEADLDVEPGLETVLASLRLGVLMLAADGTPLAWYSLGGCVDVYRGYMRSRVVSLAALRARGMRDDLVVRTRRAGSCGWTVEWLLLARRGSTFERLFSIDDEGARGCSGIERFKARIEIFAAGRLRVSGPEGVTEYRARGGKFGGKFVRAD